MGATQRGKPGDLRIVLLVASLFLLTFAANAKLLDAFENADFENRSKDGRVSPIAVQGRGYGWNANGGIRLTNFRRDVFCLPVKRSLKLKKGERYLFTLMTHYSSPAVLGQIALETWNPETKKYEGYWGRKIVPLGSGWQREELSFVPVRDLDASSEELRFILQIVLNPKSGVGKCRPEDFAEIDNATLSTEEPIWQFCNTWPTHNWVFNEKGFVRAYSSFVGAFLPRNAKPSYSLALTRPDGTVIARAEPKEDAGVLEATFGKIEYEGPAILVATLHDGGKKLGTRKRDVTVRSTYRPKENEVFVNEHGQAIVNGKPFMPLGFYSKLAYPDMYTPEELERELKRIHEAGFNFLIEYGSYMLGGKKLRDRYYGLCQKYGIRVLVDDFAGYAQMPDKLHEIGPRAKALMQYPAIMGWYTMDESSYDTIPVLERIRRELNAVAPGHVVLTCNILEPAPFLPTADVQGGDHYPITSNPDRFSFDEKYLRKAGACRPAVAWIAPQCYNCANYSPGIGKDRKQYLEKGREPKVNEMLANALSFVANGVSGFTFYSHYDLTRGPVPELYEKRWADIIQVGKALREIEKYIVGAPRAVEVPHTDVKGSSRVVLKRADDGSAMVVVYGFGQENVATFRMPEGVGKLGPSYGFVTERDGVCTYRGGNLTCDVLK